MIEFVEKGQSYYINPDLVCFIHIDLHCKYIKIQCTGGGIISITLDRQMNRDNFHQLIGRNKLINQEEQELIKKYNEKALD